MQRRFGPLVVCRSGLLAAIPLSLAIPVSSFASACKTVRAPPSCLQAACCNDWLYVVAKARASCHASLVLVRCDQKQK